MVFIAWQSRILFKKIPFVGKLLNCIDAAGRSLQAAPMEPSSMPSEEEWYARVPERFRERPEFAAVADDPTLPRVLLLGDSISMGYTLPVRRELEGVVNLHRVPDNARSTRETLGKLDAMVGPGPWRVIHFNCGIHDITRKTGDVADPDGKSQIPIGEYERNLGKLIELLSARCDRLLWARTTAIKPYGIRRMEDLRAYNDVADQVMKEAGIPVNDLFTLSAKHIGTLNDNVHFTEEGGAILGAQVADCIRLALE